MRFFDRTGLYVLPLFLGVLFFEASLTPTLIPRNWVIQGVLGGLVMGLGYLIGRIGVSLWRLMELPEPTGRSIVIARILTGVPVIVVLVLSLLKTRDWQNGIRIRMGMDLVDSTHTLQMLLLALGVFGLLVLLGYALQWLFDRVRFWLYRYMPPRTANVAGFLLTAFVVVTVTRDGVLDRVIEGLDDSVTLAQNLFDMAPLIPAGVSTGGAGSLVDWGALGQPGRDYVTTGPDADDIASFTGREALQPVRVYVGRAQADTAQERADIALAELKRQGGFDREVLIVALPTGTGWMDPGAMDTVEYMHGGDIATVAVQYSYLQSPLALILETRSGLDQAEALIGTIHNYWRDLPKDARPRLYIHGLSLGAWSSMHGTDLFALLDDPINGAMWAGPPFPSTMWQGIVASRDKGSPFVAPTLGEGRLVRFASHSRNAGGADGWGNMRIVYLQYSSDPIVFYEPASLWRAPEWMNEPPGPDVSPDMRFMPVVTQFQLAVDMALANTAPDGHGHAYYGADYVGPWVAVTAPINWTAADTDRLIAHCDGGFDVGCDHN
ncbi:alpha/beta-hydrolase family protein [Aliiroseovarius sediminis]|uniref:alpha/beta hydrolase n=1 Tax=Aliiroseovarius sediminis TaxID=2925839 RepID=UPI001F57CA5E|nr:alpha/beta-hydrolase family protein [Aliiroseovarius sediminis]MCI2394937.1 alpha/beta-hydrolase family protein [Aliiroseovarius sediminis]